MASIVSLYKSVEISAVLIDVLTNPEEEEAIIMDMLNCILIIFFRVLDIFFTDTTSHYCHLLRFSLSAALTSESPRVSPHPSPPQINHFQNPKIPSLPPRTGPLHQLGGQVIELHCLGGGQG